MTAAGCIEQPWVQMDLAKCHAELQADVVVELAGMPCT